MSKLCTAVDGAVVGRPECETNLWLRIKKGPFHKSLVTIGSVVYNRKILNMYFSIGPCVKLS